LIPAHAQGIAYGSINNFDTVNDTGKECHGFEIELEDCESKDISHTYNYNHYGVPKITQDDSVTGHPKCHIRWESKKSNDGSWAAYTAIPSGPINPTNGHQFTNPNVNFGGEHFGVGYRLPPSNVSYHWLVDDSAGNLVRGGQVQVATPTFTYYAAGAQPARVQAAIRPPPAPPVKEFGPAVWVKEIRTTTHNNEEVKLRDLISDDPNDPDDKNWRNGEPDEIEVEWQILQEDFNKANGGPNGELMAAPEDLNNGDEVVTRRYEFYEYTGPFDAESGEAKADRVAPDGLHGEGSKTVNGVLVDLSAIEVVGDYKGAQMAAIDVDAGVGLVDHVGHGTINQAFASRRIVIEGARPFTAVMTGNLPGGMSFNTVTGILSGTPTATGDFNIRITADDGLNPVASKNYTLQIFAEGEAPLPVSLLDTTASPVAGGSTSGDGAYDPGTSATAIATPEAGYRFVNWTDNGTVLGTTTSHRITLDVNHSLVANFEAIPPQYTISTSASAGGTASGDGAFEEGTQVTVVATPNVGYAFANWMEGGVEVSTAASYDFTLESNRALMANFVELASYLVTTSASPVAGGTTGGNLTDYEGSNVTVTALAAVGYAFENWTESGTVVGTRSNYPFSLDRNRTLVANFGTITKQALPIPTEEYDVTNINGWTDAQLASLPHFDRYIPAPPAGAPGGFEGSAHNGLGQAVGNRQYSSNTWVQQTGVVIDNGVATNIPAWLRPGQIYSYAWSNTYWDGTDYHFSNGFVTHSPARDINIDGIAVGYATTPGSTNQNTSSSPGSAYRDHAWILNIATGGQIDFTPEAKRADPKMINDLGEIVGNWSNETETHAFRRTAEGDWTDLSLNTATAHFMTPTAINNLGHVAGNATIYSVPNRDYRAFFSESGNATEPLPFPDQNSPDTATIFDMNDHGIIVGEAHKAAASAETNGVRWFRDNGNNWIAEDLNELVTDGTYIIERCLAINDAGYIIARGRLDGTDTSNTHTLLLTPVEFPRPTATTLSAQNITPTSATLRAKIVACESPTSLDFQYGNTTGYGNTNAVAGSIGGTTPEIATLEVNGLTPNTTYHVRVRASNSVGNSDGQDHSFSTPYDITTWIQEKFAAQANNPQATGLEKDFDGDGESTLLEYGLGHNPMLPDARSPQVARNENGDLCLIFDRPRNHAGLVYTVQVTADPGGTWHNGAGYTELVNATQHGDIETVEVRSLLSTASESKQFMRVKIKLQP
jgi:hypothetical protein